MPPSNDIFFGNMFSHFGKATKYLHQPRQTVMKLSTVYYTHTSLPHQMNGMLKLVQFTVQNISK